MDERQPHGGLGPKADVECLAVAALVALGHRGAKVKVPHG
jgi:hypothetical protein